MAANTDLASTAGTATELVDRALEQLQQLLPPGWAIGRLPDAEPGAGDGLDEVIELSAHDHATRILVEARRSLSPREVPLILGGRVRALRRFTGELPLLVVAPWLSDRTRALLAESELNYLDLAGNVRITTRHPPLFIERLGQGRPPRSRQSEVHLSGPKAGRVVRLLVDVRPPYGVVELAAAAGVTPGYASRLIAMLDREALVERTSRRGVAAVNWVELLRRRAASYSVFETNQVTWFVCPNGPEWALEAVRDVMRMLPARDRLLADVVLTGSFAAYQIVSVAAPTLLVIYDAVGPHQWFIDQARLLPADEGANVGFVRPQDRMMLERRYPVDAPLPPIVPLAGCSQLVLDCLTGTGRMPAEGEALLSWMSEDESRWRFSGLAELGSADR